MNAISTSAPTARPPVSQLTKVYHVAEFHEVIKRSPKGYQIEVRERGVGLSGGQSQRLAIAQSLIKQPKILTPFECPTAEANFRSGAVLSIGIADCTTPQTAIAGLMATLTGYLSKRVTS
jgi:ABC-type transport system involved in Fe-S cluster assembly fused permease/ATPase subunit